MHLIADWLLQGVGIGCGMPRGCYMVMDYDVVCPVVAIGCWNGLWWEVRLSVTYIVYKTYG